jgi:hypothetical protein
MTTRVVLYCDAPKCDVMQQVHVVDLLDGIREHDSLREVLAVYAPGWTYFVETGRQYCPKCARGMLPP